MSANAPQAAMSTPPTGAYQSPGEADGGGAGPLALAAAPWRGRRRRRRRTGRRGSGSARGWRAGPRRGRRRCAARCPSTCRAARPAARRAGDGRRAAPPSRAGPEMRSEARPRALEAAAPCRSGGRRSATSRRAVTTVAPPVAMTTWSRAAPPAGSAARGRGEQDHDTNQCYTDRRNMSTRILPSVSDATRTRRADDRRARAAHRHDRAQHPRAPVARPAPAARGARAHRLLRRRARRAHRAHQGAAGRRLQPRGDPAAARVAPAARPTRSCASRAPSRAPFEEEQPEVADLERAARALRRRRRPGLLERAIELGLLRPLGEGRYEERSPRLARAGARAAPRSASRPSARSTSPRRSAATPTASPRRSSSSSSTRSGSPFDEAGPPAGALARGLRRARAPAPARRRVAAGDLPDRDDRARRAGARRGLERDGRRRILRLRPFSSQTAPQPTPQSPAQPI